LQSTFDVEDGENEASEGHTPQVRRSLSLPHKATHSSSVNKKKRTAPVTATEAPSNVKRNKLGTKDQSNAGRITLTGMYEEETMLDDIKEMRSVLKTSFPGTRTAVCM
jgi:hypothetical protein